MSAPTPATTTSAATAADRDWWRQAVVYQVYPRSFADSDGSGLGDLPGLTARVDHLADLGVDALWLSPFYPSPMADGGYDVSDYRDVHPQLGTLTDFDALVAAAHGRGLKVIVDIVPNHTSDEHPWFVEALASPPGSPARDRYIFRDGIGTDGPGHDGTHPPSDWVAHFGGPAWTQVPDGQWYCHLFAPQQPDLDWRHPEVRADFLTTLRFWADRGVDGYRVDVAHALAKDLSEPLRSKPDLEDDLPVDGSDPLYDRDDVHQIYREWREVFNTYDPPRTAVAEAVSHPARRALYARPSELGQAFNFDLLKADFDAAQFAEVITFCLREAAKTGSSSTWVLSNHDVVRHPTRYGLPADVDTRAWLMSEGADPVADEARGLRRARAATALMLALPGSSYLYQGEELGLPEVADLPTELLQDPTWENSGHTEKGRDGCRVPLPWTAEGPSLGFGSGPGWLPQPAGFAALSAQAQTGAAGSTLELYRSALRLRRQLQGEETFTWVSSDGPVLHFERPGGWHCVTNFGSDPAPLPEGQLVLSSAVGPVVDQLPGETTVWFTRPRPA
ncbi:glycoside hydrolase family 13 protein [Microlunatus capsulatus]|uniref:Alpha-glucosidase n=1 Tax=Microlunatus capsulatus TaxID=99117 RepID=A0ABS4ZAG6_9ACTN|nr:glycoside hydrolase family 13 protein [Microlunatus capsulatus]MBP2418044.1 alpha-glucosidase [Microlunatus capsulatus]